MVKGVIFDLDDTLISEREYIQSGFKVISNVISNYYPFGKENLYKLLVNLFNEDNKNVFNRFLNKLQINYTSADIEYLIKIYRNHSPSINLYKDVIPTLFILRNRGYKLGIISDGFKESQRKKISAVGLEKYFEKIILTDELGREFWKPNEKPFKLMAESFDIDYKDLIYIGDNEAKDFIAPNKLGMKTVKILRKNRIYKDSSNLADARAQYTISSLIRNTRK